MTSRACPGPADGTCPAPPPPRARRRAGPIGGREGEEAPEECLLRELHEEFGLRLTPDRLVWRRVFPSMVAHGKTSVFFGGWLTRHEIGSIRFGDEGQGWELMPVEGFLRHPQAVPELQRRTGIVWGEIGG